jgi:3-oxoacyl-[acyl-carrier-protein] synthase II
MDVVVTGVGVVSALGTGVGAHRAALRAGTVGLAPAAALDLPLAAPRPLARVADPIASSAGRPAMDRGRALLLRAAEDALRHAGLRPDAPGRFLVGTTLAGMRTGTALYRQWREGAPLRRAHLRDYLPGEQLALVARALGVPCAPLLLSDACASGANAIGMAARAVASGSAPWALAGGYDPLCAFVVAGFDSLMALAPQRCQPFDRRRSGLALGEGAALLVLERADAAARRGAPARGRVLGYGASSDAHHLTHPDPTGGGAARAIAAALRDAALPPEGLAWVKAHGTGTPPNDTMEAAAIRTALGPATARVPCSSLKGTVGHTLGGAGAVEAALALCAMAERLVPPTHGLEEPDPACAGLDLVRGTARDVRPGPVLCNAFGFGGSNAALVVASGSDW